MPHSTTENGTTSPSSKTLSKLSNYPTVASGIDTFKSNPYGKKSLEIADDVYNRFGKPAQTYLETPIEYIKPYAAKADELGENALGTIEDRLPIVKEQPQTIWDSGKGYVLWPYNYGVETWNDEYSKTVKSNDNNQNVLVLLSALMSFNMRLVSDFLTLIADYTKPRYEQSKSTASEYLDAAKDKAGEVQKFAQEKLDQATQNGQAHADGVKDKAEQVKQNGEAQAEAAKATGADKVEQGKQQLGETKEQVEKGAKKSK